MFARSIVRQASARSYQLHHHSSHVAGVRKAASFSTHFPKQILSSIFTWKKMAPPYNDLTYYTFGTPNGLKPAIVLEELGLSYKKEVVDITKDVQKVHLQIIFLIMSL
jgi:hypothetical protein